ncbi:MAG: type II toxin-antitoxin system RelE/ParE family toxin [Planctomycetota bacterium]|nr:MAG: type II toxin-antitoxin system RelE/ParE family toxin [Planctomycetota bacterium]
MAEINWTAEAQQWLREIYHYIAQENPQAAKGIVDAIGERVQLLREFSEIGYRYQQVQDQHVRILLYGHYKIAYLIKPDGNIDILGVFHGAMDIERYLS